MITKNTFQYFKTSPQIVKLAVMYYLRLPLRLRQVEDVLHERGIDTCHETVRFGGIVLAPYWQNRFGTIKQAPLKLTLAH